MSDKLLQTLDLLVTNSEDVHIIFTKTLAEFNTLSKLLRQFRKIRVISAGQLPADRQCGLQDLVQGKADTLLTTREFCTGWNLPISKPCHIHYLWEDIPEFAGYTAQALGRLHRKV